MRKLLTTSFARNTLLGVWLTFLLVNLVVVLYMYLDNWIEDDTLWASLSQLNSLYVTYLGVMIAFYFAGNAKVRQGNKKANTTFVIALVVSLIWNIMVASLILKAFLLRGDRDTVYGLEDSAKQIGRIGPLLSWLVAPAIGYYFGASAATQTAATITRRNGA